MILIIGLAASDSVFKLWVINEAIVWVRLKLQHIAGFKRIQCCKHKLPSSCCPPQLTTIRSFWFHPTTGSKNGDTQSYSSGQNNCASSAWCKWELKAQWDCFQWRNQLALKQVLGVHNGNYKVHKPLRSETVAGKKHSEWETQSKLSISRVQDWVSFSVTSENCITMA